MCVFDAGEGSKHIRPNQASLVHMVELAGCEVVGFDVGGDVME